MQDLDVVEGNAQPVGHDLAPGCLMPLAVRARAGDDLDLARGQDTNGRMLPAAANVVECAQHPRGRDPAHLGEGRDADVEVDRVTGLAALPLLGAELVVAEELLGSGRGSLV